MPYFTIGKKELKTKPEIVGKLAELLKEKVGQRKSMQKIFGIIRKNIEEHNTAYLISLTAEGVPKGFINFRYPKEKQAYVEVLTVYVLPKFRRKGEATRLIYRLIAIAKRAGYAGLYNPNQSRAMLKVSEKMAAKPRKIIGREGKVKISEETGKPLKAEDVVVFSVYNGPFYRFGSAKIKFNPLADKTKQRARRIRKRI